MDGKQTLRFGPFEFEPECGQLRKDGTRLKVQGQPVQILEILLEKPGQLVTREELRHRLWTSDTFVDFDHSLNTAIKKLRQALGDEADTPVYIQTLPRRGYRFIGELAGEESNTADRETTPVTVPAFDLHEPLPSKQIRRWKLGIASSVLVLLALAPAVHFIFKPDPQPTIVGSRILTKTGYPKRWRSSSPIVDRNSLYFREVRPYGAVFEQVAITGGEVSTVLSPNVLLTDISRDGSQMLWSAQEANASTYDVWAQPLPVGPPRMVVKDAQLAIWSADGRSILFTRSGKSTEAQLYRANSDGTTVEHLATFPRFGNPHLSPDGSRIRFTGEFPVYPLWEVRADGSNPHPILGGFHDLWGGIWSSDAKYYFFTAWDGDRSSLWSVFEGQHWLKKPGIPSPKQLTFGPQSFGPPAISKDGKQLYAVGMERRGELSVYDSKTGRFVPYLGGQSVCFVDFSRDGRWIAYVTYPEGALWRSRIDGSERRQLTVPPIAPVNPRWSPDGKLIAFWDGSNGDRRKMTYFGTGRIYAVSFDGGVPMPLVDGYIGDPTWFPDGRSITYQHFQYPSSGVQILDLQTQKSTTVPGSEGLWSPRTSPNGKFLVALGGDRPNFQQKLMLFSFQTRAWTQLASTSTAFNWPCWSHDSKFVYVQDGDSVLRISVANHSKEQVASLRGLRATAYYVDRIGGYWFGLTPDDRLLTTWDTGIEEMYALDLEYK